MSGRRRIAGKGAGVKKRGKQRRRKEPKRKAAGVAKRRKAEAAKRTPRAARRRPRAPAEKGRQPGAAEPAPAKAVQPAAKLPLRKVPAGWREPLVECYRETVLALIKRLDVSDYRLAERSRISPSMIGLVVRAKSLPGLEVTGQICYAGHTSLEQILWDMLCAIRAGKNGETVPGTPPGNGAQK